METKIKAIIVNNLKTELVLYDSGHIRKVMFLSFLLYFM